MALRTRSLTLGLLIIVFWISSCKTVKYIDRVKTVVDSTAIQQNIGLQQVLKEEIEKYEKLLETANKTGVVFDTAYLPGDTVIVNKVTFDNGKLKSAEGRIRAVSQDLTEKTSELYDAHSTIDSLQIEVDRRDVELKKKVQTVTKEVTRTVTPWLLIILALVSGLVLEYYLKPFTRIKNIVMKFLPFLLLVFLAGCADYKDAPGTSVWSGGLWLIPVLTFLGSVYMFFQAWRASRTGSKRQDLATGKWHYSDENVPIYKLGKFYLGCGLLLATIVIIIMVVSDR